MFKERKTKLLTLLSLLSALVVISTAFAGASIYAQTTDEDSDLTTFEEEALKDEEEDTSGDESEAVDDSSATSIADIEGLFDGLTVCDVGTSEINESETEVAAAFEEYAPPSTPSISVEVMLRGEIVEAAATETSTSLYETEIAPANCMVLGESNDETSTSIAESKDAANGDDSDLTTFEEEEQADEEDDSAESSDSETSVASNYAEQILAIEGKDFTPGQVVLMFSGNSLVGIDEVDDDGNIDAKVPVNDVMGEIRFVESGTMRTQTFNFDGETLIAAEGVGDITFDEGSEDESVAEDDTSDSNGADDAEDDE